jgi:hypothetical protein
VGGTGGVGVVTEDPEVHFTFMGEAREFQLALEQACADRQVDCLGQSGSLGQGDPTGLHHVIAHLYLNELGIEVGLAAPEKVLAQQYIVLANAIHFPVK